MIGRKIGRFRILAKLGEGGMASVWSAADELVGHEVALKILQGPAAGSAKARRRFQHEAESQMRLHHPAIAQIVEAGEADGAAYIAMARIDGPTLSERAARSLMPIHDVLRIAREVAEGLAHAHAHGVVHRDVTGRNIMLDADGHALIVDFGLALSEGATRLTTTGSVVGTFAYLAPEVVVGGSGDARSDVYGLGAVMYEALTGRLPFVAERQEQLAYAIPNLPLQPPRELRPEIPRNVEAVVMKAMARDPAERFAGAAEMTRALDACTASAAEAAATPAAATALPGPGVLERGAPIYLGVVGFAPEGNGAADHAAPALREALEARLAGLPTVRAVTPSAGPADTGWRETAARMGANLLLEGRVRVTEAVTRVTWSLVDPVAGARLAGASLDGATADPFALEDRVVESVAASLGAPANAAAAPAARARHDPAAAEHYAQALRYLDRFDQEGAVDAGVQILERLVRDEPQDPRFHAALARACLFKYRHTAARVWQDRAATACAKAAQTDPRRSEVRLALADLRASTGRSEEAFSIYREIMPAEPDALDGFVRTALRLGHGEEARKACERAIRARPGDWQAYNLLGLAHAHSGAYREALSAWRRVRRRAPENGIVLRNIGVALFYLGHMRRAVPFYEHSVALLPSARAYSNLGSLLFFLGRYDACVEALERAVALAPADPEFLGNLGSACRQIPGREARAVEALDHAISLMSERLRRSPGDAWGRARLAGWLANRGRDAEAIAAIVRALADSPDENECMLRAGYVFLQAGDRKRALHWFREAVRHGRGVAELEHDPELESLRDDPAFAAILAEGRQPKSG